MLNTPIERPRRRLVYALYALATALLLLGLALGRLDTKRRNRIPLPVRMLSSALVLACALLLWRESGDRADRAMRQVAAGMGCGFAGDLVMARVIPLPAHVIFGMLTFGAGHVLYMRAFVERARVLGLRTERARWPALGVAWALALAGWWALVRGAPAGKGAVGAHNGAPVQYGALVYSLLLSSMSGLAASLAARDRRYAPLALGGVLFLLSDLILAGELFGKARFPGVGDVVWLTYITGQALIVGGMGMAEEPPRGYPTENREPKNREPSNGQ